MTWHGVRVCPVVRSNSRWPVPRRTATGCPPSPPSSAAPSLSSRYVPLSLVVRRGRGRGIACGGFGALGSRVPSSHEYPPSFLSFPSSPPSPVAPISSGVSAADMAWALSVAVHSHVYPRGSSPLAGCQPGLGLRQHIPRHDDQRPQLWARRLWHQDLGKPRCQPGGCCAPSLCTYGATLYPRGSSS